MKYRSFGRASGLRVSEVALGAGNFGTGWGHGATRDESKRMFDAYVAAGGNVIDTADSYQMGESETLVGEFLGTAREDFVLSTKYTMGARPKGGDGISRTGNSRKNMMRSVEASLKRLQTPYIDVFWAHLPDGSTPLEEILRGFDDLVRSGKVLYVGLSNFQAWRVSRADVLAELMGWPPIIAIQCEYSLVERSADRELIPMAEALGLGIASWSPLGGGFLTGKYRLGQEGRLTKLGVLIHSETSARETVLLDAVMSVANEAGVAPVQVAMGWLLEKAKTSSTTLMPILGPRTEIQLAQSLGSLALELSAEHLSRLDEASQIALGVPHEQVASSRASLAGGQPDLLVPRTPPVP